MCRTAPPQSTDNRVSTGEYATSVHAQAQPGFAPVLSVRVQTTLSRYATGVMSKLIAVHVLAKNSVSPRFESSAP